MDHLQFEAMLFDPPQAASKDQAIGGKAPQVPRAHACRGNPDHHCWPGGDRHPFRG